VIRWSRDGTPMRSLPNAYGALAEVEYRIGRWDDGLTHAEVAVSLGEDTDRAWDLPFVHAVASYLHSGRGAWGFAAEHADAARRAAEIAPVPLSRYYACVAAAHLAWVREDWETVLASLAPLHKPPGALGTAGLDERVPWLLDAEAMIFTGRLEEAARVLDELERAVAEVPTTSRGSIYGASAALWNMPTSGRRMPGRRFSRVGLPPRPLTRHSPKRCWSWPTAVFFTRRRAAGRRSPRCEPPASCLNAWVLVHFLSGARSSLRPAVCAPGIRVPTINTA